ncbi:hypothetical protein [Paenibacillus antri]|uniref:hypothetical protein n=1 Tax=Paenibacillus antri TaxID=2582848 RepID=UPI001EE4699C|nr:hypothetical protein [Paenibacillus antri]
MKHNRKWFALLLLISLLFGSLPTPGAQAAAGGAEFFIAPNGSDSNAGTVESPFLTLERAREAIRSLKATSGLPQGGVTVYLRGGEYERTQSFLLDERDSGAADARITYKAYPGESVTLTGGMKLDKSWFVPVEDPVVLNRIVSVEARGKVLQADLASRGITDYGQMSRHGYYLANDVSLVPPMGCTSKAKA